MHDLRREIRWSLNAKTFIWIFAFLALCTLWFINNSVMHLHSVADQFSHMREDYAHMGVTLSEALRKPNHVVEGLNFTTSDNPLRDIYEDYHDAFHAATPLGGLCNFLSIATLIVVPPMTFIMGVETAIHDRRNGSIVHTWPASGLKRFISAKVMFLILTSVVIVCGSAVCGFIGGGIASSIYHPRVPDGFSANTSSFCDVIFLVGLVTIIGVIASFIGLAIGSLINHTAIPILLFSILYLAIPLGGYADPRFWITDAARGLINPIGVFHVPPPSDHWWLSWLLLAATGIVCLVMTALAWKYRSRVPLP